MKKSSAADRSQFAVVYDWFRIFSISLVPRFTPHGCTRVCKHSKSLGGQPILRFYECDQLLTTAWFQIVGTRLLLVRFRRTHVTCFPKISDLNFKWSITKLYNVLTYLTFKTTQYDKLCTIRVLGMQFSFT